MRNRSIQFAFDFVKGGRAKYKHMGQKVHPLAFRMGILANWKSRWFNTKKYRELLRQDIKLRSFIMGKLDKAGVERIEIERLVNSLKIIIRTAKPGLVIGRGGSGIEELKEELKKIVKKDDPRTDKIEIKLEIEEIRQPESQAAVMAQSLAEQMERRLPYRRTIKRVLDKIRQNKDVRGAKLIVKGRLDGAEIARVESLKFGKIPLQTLRSDIDYAEATAYTTYGTVGVKVWIYKGEVF